MIEETLGDRFSHALIGEGIVVKINKKNQKLLSNIEFFQKECLKRGMKMDEENYGVIFFPRWDRKYGFVYKMSCNGCLDFTPYNIRPKGFTFEQFIEANKKQLPVIKKARHNLACLIRLRNKLKLPGPIQKCATDFSKGLGHYLVVVSQEEIDDILKY